MIRGMSYKNGIFFMNKNGIAHATFHKEKVVTYYEPISPKAFMFLFQRLLISTPIYLLLLVLIFALAILRPDFLFANNTVLSELPEFPLYTMILLLFGYHFIFPKQLKKYHGAEHKVFSYRGRRHIAHMNEIATANIVNRNCSTNTVVLFFVFFLISFPFFGGWIATLTGWLALVLIPRFWPWGDKHIFFPISAFLQKKLTTTNPDEKHLRVAILSYMSLIAERPLVEADVWKDYEQELENLRLQEEERKKQLEQERIIRLIVDQERRQMDSERWREQCILNELSRLERQRKIEAEKNESIA